MSKLVQLGHNPRYPKEIKKYWRYTDKEAAPEWLTDLALISGIHEFPELSVVQLNTGGLEIKGAIPGTTLVVLRDQDSWIYLRDPGILGSMTNKQKEILYEEV